MDDELKVVLEDELWLHDGVLSKPWAMIRGKGAAGIVDAPVRVFRPGTVLAIRVVEHR